MSTPNAVGLSQANAETAIVQEGLTVGAVSLQPSASVAAGVVTSQSPAAGTDIELGASVDLVVSSGPSAPDVSDTFSDEFDANSLSEWSLRHVVEGTSPQYSLLDVDQTTPGSLTIVPTQTPGWFRDGDGPLIFKLLNGDFAVHTAVRAESRINPGEAPSSNFNSAGLMARDPAGGDGPENYIMLNVGTQNDRIAGGVGSETKTTDDSNSELFLDAGSNRGELILCRVGDDFISFRFLEGDTGWTETNRFARSDLPQSLQVGLVVSAFAAPADLQATFDFVRLLPTPASSEDCLP